MSRTSQPFGLEIKRGVEASKNEIKGSTICPDFEFLDFQNTIANIPDIIRQAHTKGISTFLGLGTTDQVIAAMPALHETGSLLITPTASGEELTKQGSRVVMMFPRNSTIAEKLAEHSFKSGVRNIITIYASNSHYSENLREEFNKAFGKLGGKIDRSIAIRMKEDLSPNDVSLIRDSKATHLFLPLFELDVAQVLNTLQANKIHRALIGTDAWGTSSTVLLNLTQATPFLAWMPEIYSPNSTDVLNRAFRKSYKKISEGEPTDLAAFSYDGVLLYKKLLRTCNIKKLVEKPEECLASALPFSGATGTTHTAQGLSLNRDVAIKSLVQKKVSP